MPCITKTNNKGPLKTVKVSLGGDDYVFVRELSTHELFAVQNLRRETPDKYTDSELLYRCLVDEAGKPIFDSAEDVQTNLDVGLSTYQALCAKVLEVSGITPKN